MTHIPDSVVLTLREARPSSDSCGDPSLEELLPEGCGAEAVFNFSWEKEVGGGGSGDDDDDDVDGGGGGGGDGRRWTTTVGTAVVFTRTLLSANRTTRSTEGAPNRTVSRLPPRFTPSPETRHASFQQLLRLHMNTFNQRLSMLERNTLDMKESLQRVEEQQKRLSSQLEELLGLRTAGEKDKQVKELEESYSDMESRLSRLEGRLEILIDGFTALAQEMNRIKRARVSSRSPKEGRLPPPTTTIPPLTSSSTPRPPATVRTVTRTFSSTVNRTATVLRSIPTPAFPTSPAAGTSTSPGPTRSMVKAQSTPGPRTPRPRATWTTRQVPLTRATDTRREAAITKFQLDPPIHTADPSKPDRNRRRKAFRSDAPVPRDTSEEQQSSSEKKVLTSVAPASTVPTRAPAAGSRKSAPPKPRSTTAKRPSTAGRGRTPPSKRRTTKTITTAKRSKTTPPRTRARSVSKRRKVPPAQKPPGKNQKPPGQRPSVLDLLQLLKGEKSAPHRQSQDSSLHVVLGRLAIPIKIIPDY